MKQPALYATNLKSIFQEAGGVPVTSATILLTVAKVIFYAKIYIRKLVNKACQCQKKTRERMIILLMVSAQIILLIMLLGAIIVVITIPELWNNIRSNGAKSMSTLSIILTVYATIWIPWYLCYFEVKDKKKKPL